MSDLTIKITLPTVEHAHQFHAELSDIIQRLAFSLGQTGVPLPTVATDRNGVEVGSIVWGPDAFVRDRHSRDQRRAELEVAKARQAAMSAEDQFKVKQYLEEG
jgi:hypothetical protein